MRGGYGDPPRRALLHMNVNCPIRPGYLFSVLSKRCHFDRALAKGEGERRNLVVRTRITARFLDSLRSLGMTR